MPDPAALLHLGCPVWACTAWRGGLFTAEAQREDFLPQYARVFRTVEGNSTFYGLPAPDTMRRWAGETPPGFRFCFKFPQVITHRMMLRYVEAETREFLDLVTLARARTGPLLLQLPPNFGPADLPVLARYLAALPRDFRYAVEVRHPEFFERADAEQRLDALLAAEGVSRCHMDTRDVFAAPLEDEDDTTREAQARKPRVPLREHAVGDTVLLRFVGRNRWEASAPALDAWAERVADWLSRGITVYWFTHAPDDAHAPDLARLAHRLLRARLPSLTPLAAFPGESELGPRRQLALF